MKDNNTWAKSPKNFSYVRCWAQQSRIILQSSSCRKKINPKCNKLLNAITKSKRSVASYHKRQISSAISKNWKYKVIVNNIAIFLTSWPGFMSIFRILWAHSSKSKLDWIVRYNVLRKATRFVSVLSMITVFSLSKKFNRREMDQRPRSTRNVRRNFIFKIIKDIQIPYSNWNISEWNNS